MPEGIMRQDVPQIAPEKLDKLDQMIGLLTTMNSNVSLIKSSVSLLVNMNSSLSTINTNLAAVKTDVDTIAAKP